jgi:hypothetical protein
MSTPMLLTPGNSKIGKGIWCFSIPAVHTCPGKTSLCSKLCYATKGFYKYTNTKSAIAIRDAARKEKDFEARIRSDITSVGATTVRIHVSGDFDSISYARKWLRIIQSLPDVKFFFYTRSWRLQKMRPVIDDLLACRNVTGWLSCDKETGRPPDIPNAGLAYMAIDDEDVPDYATQMVFRVVRKTKKVVWGNGSTVCPVERTVGTARTSDKLTCTTCKLCHAGKMSWLHQFQEKHDPNAPKSKPRAKKRPKLHQITGAPAKATERTRTR